MTKLQTPKYALWNGELIPWNEANLHVGCEGVNRGLSVFEGIKGYWRVDGQFGLIQLKKHYDRLLRSARLLHIPCSWSYEEFEEGVIKLITALLTKEKDMWIRTTLFVVEGHWGQNTRADLVMTAYNQDKGLPEPINLGISTWQRSTDISLPYRIKAASNYQVGRLARMEGRSRHFQDMVLLNRWGRVAEATGSCILMIRENKIYTPPSTEGALESITLDFVESLAKSRQIEFIQQPIDRTELLIADELAICGTLAELVPVKLIDNFTLNPDGPILGKIRKDFFDAVRGRIEHPDLESTTIQL
ncbi:MAG: aminotransferase class IV [Aurantibacter sp.]